MIRVVTTDSPVALASMATAGMPSAKLGRQKDIGAGIESGDLVLADGAQEADVRPHPQASASHLLLSPGRLRELRSHMDAARHGNFCSQRSTRWIQHRASVALILGWHVSYPAMT
jgi:hypothetical protein